MATFLVRMHPEVWQKLLQGHAFKAPKNIPVIEPHDHDGKIIGYASTSAEAAKILRSYCQQPDADAGYFLDGQQDFFYINNDEISEGYWAQ